MITKFQGMLTMCGGFVIGILVGYILGLFKSDE